MWVSVVQIVYFIVELSVGGFAYPFTRFPPHFGPPGETLILLGAKSSRLIKNNYELWRLVTPIFMHANVLHILFNLLVQLSLGLGYERKWNIFRTIFIYFVSGIGGNLMSCVALVNGVGVGASGAIMGLIGAKLGWIVCNWFKLTVQLRIYHLTSIAFVTLFTLIASFSEYVDWAAHIGGLFLGVFCGLLVFANQWHHKNIKIQRTLQIMSGVVGAFVIFVFFLTFSLVFAFATVV